MLNPLADFRRNSTTGNDSHTGFTGGTKIANKLVGYTPCHPYQLLSELLYGEIFHSCTFMLLIPSNYYTIFLYKKEL